jgi:sporulation protein YlmC with PRC-barrel domain
VRTFSSLIGRRVETRSGERLGRIHDLVGELAGDELEITAICVGRGGYLARLGIPGHRHDEIPWSAIVRIDGDRIVVDDQS